MKYTMDDFNNIDGDSHPLWWIQQLTKEELRHILRLLHVFADEHLKRDELLDALLVNANLIYAGRNENYYREIRKLETNGAYPISIIVRHKENDWTRRASSEAFAGFGLAIVDVGARLIAWRDQ